METREDTEQWLVRPQTAATHDQLHDDSQQDAEMTDTGAGSRVVDAAAGLSPR